MEVHIAGEADEAGIVQAHDAVNGTALYGGDAGLLIIEEDELEVVDAGRATPVVLVGVHDGAVAGDDLIQDEWSGAIEIDADILRARLENDEFVVGQVVEKVWIRLAQGDGDLVVAGGCEGGRGDQAGHQCFPNQDATESSRAHRRR